MTQQIDQLKQENKEFRQKIIDHAKERQAEKQAQVTPMDLVNAFVDLPFTYQLCGLYRQVILTK